MRLLVDTHVLLWWLADDSRLPARHRTALADASNDVWFSAVSIAEAAIKSSLGKLTAPAEMADVLVDGGFRELPLTAKHAAMLRTLPWHHRDPFDRMLVSQAGAEGLVLATVDRRFAEYDVTVL